ncbi:MAG TPA: glycosyltransferase family 2 protein [Candidatus Dormibacteraeota bacterium]|nr:glycosyltransferase family 2 protein [Candidatus Dormibacteraeota bacterium]
MRRCRGARDDHGTLARIASPERMFYGVGMAETSLEGPTTGQARAAGAAGRGALSLELDHPTLSIVMPVFNEGAVIEQVVRELDAEIVEKLGTCEMVVVDDCSTDDTHRILSELSATLPQLTVVRNEPNRGHGPSVLRALDMATGDWIFQVDSDRQHLAAEFWDLWAVRDDADLVLGVRRQRRDGPYRLLITFFVRLGVSMLARRRIRDSNVPFRLYRRELWQDVGPLMEQDTLAPSIHLAVGAALRGWRIVEVEVTHLPRVTGLSFHRGFRVLKFSLRGLRQLIRFRMKQARSPRTTTRPA